MIQCGRVPTMATLLVLTVSGCGSGEVILQGRIVEGGKPIQVPATTPFTLSLASVGEDKQAGRAFSGMVEPDGNFTVSGPRGQGIPPGRYKITLVSAGSASAPTPAPLKRLALSDPARTPLSYDVTADRNQRIVIDVGKGTVRREE
jgi:hypothetical protein